MPHDIIDNSKIKLADELKKKLAVSKRARFAVGWFFLTGLKEIKEEIDQLDKVQILVGARTNKQTAESLLLAKRYEQAVKDILEIKQHPPQQEVEKILEEEFQALVDYISFIKPTQENISFIKWFFEKLRQKKIEIRIHPKEALHAKLYLLDYKDSRHGRGIAFVGSSNLSMSGFNLNTELNVAVHGDENHRVLSRWFNEKWKDSERADFTVLAQKALKKSWVLNDEVTPFRIYLRVLHEIFSYEKQEIPETQYGEVKLWDFQKDAVIDAYHRLMKYNGVFLADVPGLGKTYMGAALLTHLQEEGKRALVICPPKLIDQWKDVLAEFGVGTARVFSFGKLDAILNDEKLLKREVVLIDEAHHFRNPSTNRYQDMEIICEGKKVILLGATPQNLSIWDLYHQIKLFTPSEVNHKFRIDPPALKDFFKACERGIAEIENLVNDIVIRRTRKDVVERYGKEKIPHFPKRKSPYRVEYSIDKVYSGGIYQRLNYLIDKLTFARYDIGSYVKEGVFTPDEKQRIKQAGKNLRKIMKIILFRRLESSIKAFKDSLELMIKSQKAFLKALEQGKVLAAESAESVIDQLKSDVDLEDLEIPESAYETEGFYWQKLKKHILKDKEVLEEMYSLIKDVRPEQDEKLIQLVKLLSHREIKGKKVLIFTAFASTAEYLGKELQKHFDKVDFVSQGTGKVLLKAKRFAPKANNYKVKPSEEINILVSTELLGEGMNLQDGEVVINYELHWNPVRIIQRIGRIDRIGSRHDKIWVYNFFPQQEVEKEINIEKKVKKRIEEIIKIYGADTKTISEDEQEIRKKLYQIYSQDKKAFEEEEKTSRSAYFRHQWTKLKQKYPEEYKKALSLPAMVTSGIESEKKGVVIFCRSDNYFRLLMANRNGQIINRNDWEILSLIECGRDKKAKKILPNHLKIIEAVKEKFEEEVNKREIKKIDYLEKIKIQIIKKLEWVKRGKNSVFKNTVDSLIDSLREAKLGPKEKRELRKIRRQYGLTPEELVKKIEAAILYCPKEERHRKKRKYAQIIISESLVVGKNG